MKLSYLFGAGALLAVGCGQFSEVTLQIQTLDANKDNATALFGAENHKVLVKDIRVKFLNATLKGQKADTVLFAEQDLDLGDDELVDAELDVDVIEADLFDALEVNIDEIEVLAEIDVDGDNIVESTVTMLFEKADVDLTFDFQGFDSTKQNANIIIDVDLKALFAATDFAALVFDAANADFLIDGDVNTAALDDITDFLEEPANITGNYFLSEQAERVKAP
jgi:hypothetical protein